jgi:type I restriction enzyme S subunit
MQGEWKIEPLDRLVATDRAISYGIVQPGSPTIDGVPIVRVTDIRDGRIATTDPLRVAREIEAAYGRTRLQGGELLLTLVGTVGEAAVVPESLAGWNTARAVAVIPVREDIGAYWVKLALRSPEVRQVIDSRINTTVQATLNLRDVAQLPIVLPPENERRTIAHILGTLDDKIELNRRMNETLEAIARALFKSWFIDFDPVRAKTAGLSNGLPRPLADLFPGSFEDSEIGEIPKGWVMKPLSTLLSLDKGLSYKGQYLSPQGTQMVNLGCFLGGGRFTPAALKAYAGEFRPRHVVRQRDLVLANTDITQKRLILGSPGIVPPLPDDQSEAIFTHHVFAARFHDCKEKWKLFVFFSLLRDEFRERATGFATGTTVLALPRDAVLEYQFAQPGEPLVEAFNSVASSILERQWLAAGESRTLATLRNTLLPKLISGDIRVKDAELLVGNVL